MYDHNPSPVRNVPVIPTQITPEIRAAAWQYLRQTMLRYRPISDESWQEFRKLGSVRAVAAGSRLLQIGEIPRSFFFVYRGLFRAFALGGADGEREVNKVFFEEGRFPGSMPALLTGTASTLCLEALEDSLVIELDHARYRRLLQTRMDLAQYQIAYLERHWVVEKEPQEISLLHDASRERYASFLKQYAHVAERIPLHHIASRIGITPTQLSRIRKTFS